MTATEQWIEDVVKGDFVHPFNGNKIVEVKYFSERVGRMPTVVFKEEDGSTFRTSVAELLLIPGAWQAVGKVRGWRERSEGTFEAEMECWQAYWDTFFADLREQVTIEEALKSLETN